MTEKLTSAAPIGVFDSGIGGLTVFRQLRSLMPHENLVYLGDTARVPYGSKSVETVRKYSENNAAFLVKKKVKLIVVACNTASASALGYLRKTFDGIPIVGVIHPVIEHVLTMAHVTRVGVIGTNTTVNTGSYQRELRDLMNVDVISKACQLFVPFVEEGITDGSLILRVIEHYLADMKKKNPDTLILGCTHYPLLVRPLSYFFGKEVRILDSAYHTAVKTKQLLAERGLLHKGNDNPSDEIYVTDDPAGFEKTARDFLGSPIKNIRHI